MGPMDPPEFQAHLLRHAGRDWWGGLAGSRPSARLAGVHTFALVAHEVKRSQVKAKGQREKRGQGGAYRSFTLRRHSRPGVGHRR